MDVLDGLMDTRELKRDDRRTARLISLNIWLIIITIIIKINILEADSCESYCDQIGSRIWILSASPMELSLSWKVNFGGAWRELLGYSNDGSSLKSNRAEAKSKDRAKSNANANEINR